MNIRRAVVGRGATVVCVMHCFTMIGCYDGKGLSSPAGTSSTSGGGCCYAEVGTDPLTFTPQAYLLADSSYACQDTDPSHTNIANSYRAISTTFQMASSTFNGVGGWGQTAVEQLFTDTAAKWNVGSPDFDFRLHSGDCPTSATNIDENGVQCVGMGGVEPQGTDAAARTECHVLTDNACAHVECDIWFYTERPADVNGDRTISWAIEKDAPGGEVSMFRILVHELGHAVGLGDNIGFPGSIMDAVVDVGSADFIANGYDYIEGTPSRDDNMAFIWIYGREPP